MFQSDIWHRSCFSIKHIQTNKESVMTTTNKCLIICLTVISGFGIISCGPQKTGSATAASSSFSSTTGTISSNKAITSCSADVAGLSDLSVKLQTYSMSGAENSSWVRTRFTRFPSTFDTASVISFWAYSVDSVGNSSALQQPTFYVEYINSSNQAVKLSNDITQISWSDLKNMLGQVGIDTTSVSTAMPQINFVVKFESSLSYSQVVMPTLYFSNGSPDRYVSALIPKFYANPSDYAVGKAAALQALHPLKSMASGTWTAQQFLAQSQANCIY